MAWVGFMAMYCEFTYQLQYLIALLGSWTIAEFIVCYLRANSFNHFGVSSTQLTILFVVLHAARKTGACVLLLLFTSSYGHKCLDGIDV